MRLIRLPKKRPGEWREICVPDDEEMEALKALVPTLNTLCAKHLNHDVAHGFMMNRSPVSNALCHIGFNHSLGLDLSNHFDTVTMDMLGPYVPPDLLAKCFINGRAYQGMPTSPAIANLACVKMDRAIVEWLDKMQPLIGVTRYSRYCDDLVISHQPHSAWLMIRDQVTELARQSGFAVNHRKTHLQSTSFGNRVITGVSVSSTGITATRSARKRLRALKHILHRDYWDDKAKSYDVERKGFSYLMHQVEGLSEWCKVKRPKHSIEWTVGVLIKLMETCIVKARIKDYAAPVSPYYTSTINVLKQSFWTDVTLAAYINHLYVGDMLGHSLTRNELGMFDRLMRKLNKSRESDEKC